MVKRTRLALDKLIILTNNIWSRKKYIYLYMQI